MSAYQCFTVDITDHIAHVQLSRPDELNSMNKAFWVELPQCMRAIEASGDARKRAA